MNENEKDIIVDIMNIDELLDTIRGYLIENDTQKLRQTFFEIRSMFKKLYK